MSKKIYETDAQTMADLTAGKETVWKNPRYVPFDLVRGLCDLVVSEADIADAEARLARFAPFLERAFPETQANHGLIESPLAELEKMQPALEKAYGGKIPGRLLLKKDSHLDIAGSVKARGGIYEVLKHAEDLALAAGKITVTDDYAAFADEDMQKFLGGYTVQVGSTGNLGLSIGIMSAALGFRVIVHMSADAKQWKKDLLRSKGVEVIERTGTSVDEIALAAQALVSDGVQAVFTPTDNTVMKSELTIYETFAEAGIPHYTGADSFALNGAFLGYGVDYANLGVETANMIASILLDGADPAATAVKTFDNGTATINTEICEQLGIDFDELSEKFAPYCTKVQSIVTAESFDEVQ